MRLGEEKPSVPRHVHEPTRQSPASRISRPGLLIILQPVPASPHGFRGGEAEGDMSVLRLKVHGHLNLHTQKTHYRFLMWMKLNLVNFTTCDCQIIRFLKLQQALRHFNTLITRTQFSRSVRNVVFPTHIRKMPEELRNLPN